MRLDWTFSRADVTAVQSVVREQRHRPFVRSRIERNVTGPAPAWSDAAFWMASVRCLLTTQQRSGPDNAVTRFLDTRPAPLALSRLRRERSPGKYARRELSSFGGIRRTSTIAAQIEENLEWLSDGGWGTVRYSGEALTWYRLRRPTPDARIEECQAANVVLYAMQGFGPKQSRNLWQMLGLSRYEIPIDSRITKWLNEHGFPFKIAATSLSDPAVYDLVSQAVQALCAKARVLPCVLDAAIFSSFDEDDWTEQQLRRP